MGAVSAAELGGGGGGSIIGAFPRMREGVEGMVRKGYCLGLWDCGGLVMGSAGMRAV